MLIRLSCLLLFLAYSPCLAEGFKVVGDTKASTTRALHPEEAKPPLTLCIDVDVSQMQMGPKLHTESFYKLANGQRVFLGWVQTTQLTSYPFDVKGINERLFKMYGPGTAVAQGKVKSLKKNIDTIAPLQEGHVLITSAINMDTGVATWHAVKRVSDGIKTLDHKGVTKHIKDAPLMKQPGEAAERPGTLAIGLVPTKALLHFDILGGFVFVSSTVFPK